MVSAGEYGSLYKGRLVDGTLVAINKLFTQPKGGGELQFRTEVDAFSIMGKHRNLLRLRGFCMTSKERFLVYPYMVNGSLASRLRVRPKNVPPLDWKTRKRIALGSARGLSYLHENCDTKIIHRNVNASSILLDEEYEAVVGDFSLAAPMNHNDAHVSEGLRGTKGRITPEYLSTRITSEKTDVYGFGFMLLELINGQSAFYLGRLATENGATLLDWVKGLLKQKKLKKLVDPSLGKKFVEAELVQLIKVALLCTQSSASGRPKMSEVVRLLEGKVGGLSEKWDEWEKVEKLRVQEVEIALRPTLDWINAKSTDGSDY